ncbi:MAG: lipid kinase [Rhizobiaceae bacterium]|nr:lipid kinase [Rhizobiaceae bacterium]
MPATSETPKPFAPPRRAVMLVNPNARRGTQSLEPALARLAAAGIMVTREHFSGPGEVRADILRHARNCDAVILCGGDGTLNAAAPALIETGLPLGIIPMGTANDLARTLGIPEDAGAAAGIIAGGARRTIDLGEVNGHPFFNVASMGLSSDLAHSLDKTMKRRFGKLGYALAAARVLMRARNFRAMIITKSGVTRVKTLQIAVGNGRHYGGGNVVEETAAIDDGHLDLYSLELGSVWKLALMARDFRAGSHGAWREVRTERCTEFEVRTRQPMPVNTDGELVTQTPARFRLLRNAVTVFAPPAIAARDV